MKFNSNHWCWLLKYNPDINTNKNQTRSMEVHRLTVIWRCLSKRTIINAALIRCFNINIDSNDHIRCKRSQCYWQICRELSLIFTFISLACYGIVTSSSINSLFPSTAVQTAMSWRTEVSFSSCDVRVKSTFMSGPPTPCSRLLVIWYNNVKTFKLELLLGACFSSQ